MIESDKKIIRKSREIDLADVLFYEVFGKVMPDDIREQIFKPKKDDIDE